MFNQDRIIKYYEYGFTPDEIAEEFDLPVEFVKLAIDNHKKSTEIPFITRQFDRWKYSRYGTTRVIKSLELLWEVGPRKFDKLVRQLGINAAAKELGVSRNLVFAAKSYFGYYEKIPEDAWNFISYVPLEIREKVDARDKRHCIRCKRKIVNDKELRYHKIYWKGPMEPDNVATVCRLCRREKIFPVVLDNPEMFKNMRYKEFERWINRIVPPLKKNYQKKVVI